MAQHPARCPGSLALKLSRCKPGMARFLPVFVRRSLGEGGHGTPVVELDECRGTSRLIAGNSSVMVCFVKFSERWQVFVMVH